MSPPIDLAAIKARSAEAREYRWPAIDADVDALVAEVERLRAERQLAACALYHEILPVDNDADLLTSIGKMVDLLDSEHRGLMQFNAELQAIRDAGGDLLWAGGAKTLPEAVAGICHAYTVELDRRERERDRSPAAKAREAHPHIKYTDADLVTQAVHRAGRGEYRRVRWSVVGEIFTAGSGVAQELCRACGLDPDEMVGDDGEGEE